MRNRDLKIGVCIMVNNMAPFLGACINTLKWVDGIFLFDDHSIDRSVEVAIHHSEVPIIVEKSNFMDLAFNVGEVKVRNHIIDRAFHELGCGLLIILDADELLSEEIKPSLLKIKENSNIDGIMFTTWHLFDNARYFHIWESTINDVAMIDPHLRIIRPGKKYRDLFEDGSHPIIESTASTMCLNGPYHFHLKYHKLSPLPNYSFYFLPKRPTTDEKIPFLRNLPFELPSDIKCALEIINWNNIPFYEDTPHYNIDRITLKNPVGALVHPKELFYDKIKKR